MYVYMELCVLGGKGSFNQELIVSLRRSLEKKKILGFGIETVLFSDLPPHSKKLVVRLTSSERRRRKTPAKGKGRFNCSAKAQTCSEK